MKEEYHKNLDLVKTSLVSESHLLRGSQTLSSVHLLNGHPVSLVCIPGLNTSS